MAVSLRRATAGVRSRRGRLSLAIRYPGDRPARDRSDPAVSRFRNLFDAFASAGVLIEPAIYHDHFPDEVLQQLLGVHGVLVWHNFVEGGRDRSQLDAVPAAVAVVLAASIASSSLVARGAALANAAEQSH